MENKYNPYSLSELNTIIREPWEISDQPYKLHAAFAVSCLFELLDPNQDVDDFDDYADHDKQNCWGQTIDKKTLDRLVKDITEDFNDAATNRKPIRIWDKSYSIRKINAYDHNRIDKIFNFPLKDGQYEIVPEGIMNLAGPESAGLKSYEVTKEQHQSNKTYLRQIIMLAEDDENNGWDKLTDMELLIYCWALFYNKNQVDNLKQFLEEYKEYVYVTNSDIQDCLNAKSALREKPIGLYAFSSDKTREWNKNHNQVSVAESIPPEKADDYWYSKALTSTFKPIDFK